MISVLEPSDLAAFVGAEAESQDRILISEPLINAFIAVSGDDQPLHRGADAIAPGNLLVALTPRLLKRAIEIKNFTGAVTARMDRIAFRRPVHVGDHLRLRAQIVRVSRLPSRSALRVAVAVDCVLATDAPAATLRVIDVYNAPSDA
ncbi:MAG: hypothetical protein MRY74_14605 [Neomegalonema sp.]|nr:hypothetical protein [Neomegalonema sp.]